MITPKAIHCFNIHLIHKDGTAIDYRVRCNLRSYVLQTAIGLLRKEHGADFLPGTIGEISYLGRWNDVVGEGDETDIVTIPVPPPVSAKTMDNL